MRSVRTEVNLVFFKRRETANFSRQFVRRNIMMDIDPKREG